MNGEYGGYEPPEETKGLKENQDLSDGAGISRRSFLRAGLGFFASATEMVAAQKSKKKSGSAAKKSPQKESFPHQRKGQEKRIPGPTPLELQHRMARSDGLEYLGNEQALKNMVGKEHSLVELPKNSKIIYDPYLSEEGEFKLEGKKEKYRKYKRHYCRPWTKEFLEDLAEYYFHDSPKPERPLVVTSAVRPQDFQDYMRAEKISNTAVKNSVHATGATVDIAYGMVSKKMINGKPETYEVKTEQGKKLFVKERYPAITPKQKDNLYKYLNDLERKGLLLVRTEINERVFHVIVAKKYSEWRKSRQLKVK